MTEASNIYVYPDCLHCDHRHAGLREEGLAYTKCECPHLLKDKVK